MTRDTEIREETRFILLSIAAVMLLILGFLLGRNIGYETGSHAGYHDGWHAGYCMGQNVNETLCHEGENQ